MSLWLFRLHGILTLILVTGTVICAWATTELKDTIRYIKARKTGQVFFILAWISIVSLIVHAAVRVYVEHS